MTSSNSIRAFFAFVLFLCFGAPAAAATWLVNAGAAAGGDGSAERPFRSLQEAEAASGSGDTITIVRGSGPYEEGLRLKDGQTLQASAEPAAGAAPLIVSAAVDGLVLKSGTTVAGIRIQASEHSAIIARDAANLTLRDVTLELSGTARGILFAKSSAISLQNVKVAHAPGANAPSCKGESCGTAIELHEIDGMTLDYVAIENSPRYGITGDAVRDLTMKHAQIRGAGDEIEEHGVFLRNIAGTLHIEKSEFDANESRQLHLVQSSGEATIEIRETKFRGAAPPNGQQGMLLQASGDAKIRVSVEGSTFTENFGNAVHVIAEGESVMTLDVSDNTFRKNAAAVAAMAANGAKLTYRIARNSIQQSSSTALNVHATTSAPVSGEIVENKIGAAGKPGAVCGGACGGISVTAIGRGTSTAIIDRNAIAQTDANGIVARAGGDATLNVRITGNRVSDPAGSDTLHAIAVNAGMRKADRAAVCAEVGGAGELVNTVSGSWNSSGGGAAIGLTRRGDATSLAIAGYAGDRTNSAGLSKFVAGRNRGAAVEAVIGDGVILSDGCVTP